MSSYTVDWLELSLQVTVTFVHFAWQGFVVGIALVVAQRLCDLLRASHARHRTQSFGHTETDTNQARIRYTLACVAFFALPVCVVATFAWIHQSRGPVIVAGVESENPVSFSAVFASVPNPMDKNVPSSAIMNVGAVDAPSDPHRLVSWTDRLRSCSPCLLFAYVIGAVVMLGRVCLSVFGGLRLRQTVQPSIDVALRQIIVEQAKRLGLKRMPVVSLCRRVSVPMVIGILRPMILLPPSLVCGLDPNQLAAILFHEMAHIRRYDLLVNLMQRVVEALLFFHPVTWWISRRVSIERENCCDDMAAAGCGRMEYAAALLRIAEQCSAIRGLQIAPQLESLAADGGSASQLGYRIRRLLGEDHAPRLFVTRGAIVTSAIVALIGGTTVIAIAQPSPKPMTADPPAVLKSDASQPKPILETAADEQTIGRYAGIVKGPDGKPFAGAKIYMVANQGDAEKLGAVRAVTDERGQFDFVAPDMTYAGYDDRPLTREGLIVAFAKGFAPDWMETWGHDTSGITEYWTPRQGAEIDLQLAKADVPIEGQFLDTDGKPLANSRVRLTALMLPRDRDLTKHLDRWSKADVSAGFLTRVPDYKRELMRTELLPDVDVEARTDADGRFKITGLGRDRLARIQVTSPSVLTKTIEVMTRQTENVGMFLDFNGKPTRTVYGSRFSLQLEAGVTVRGVVRDRDSKQPIAGMWVTRIYAPVTTPSRWTRDVPITDENGRFTVTGLDPKLMDSSVDKNRMFTAMPKPGVPYLQARGVALKDKELLIECVRGIPFQLKVVDQSGRPVEAEVDYYPVRPNRLSEELVLAQMEGTNWPITNRAARRDDGIYEGFALPGPGAVTIKASGRYAYRPAFVDPKAFFEPGRTAWPDGPYDLYGTTEKVEAYGKIIDQNRVHAILLVSPAADSKPLQLAETLIADRPRQVRLVDVDGNPMTGVVSKMNWADGETEEVLSESTFQLKGLHPQRFKTMTFFKKEPSLVGRLDARGDDDSPIIVRMQPGGTLKGRVIDANGQPLKGIVRIDGERAGMSLDSQGRFKTWVLVPDHAYRFVIRRPGFVRVKTIEDVVLQSGQHLDLGDIQVSGAPASPQPIKGR